MSVKLKYIWPALKSQLPLSRMFRNFVLTRNAWGMFSKRAHYKFDGSEKVRYNTKATADKAAASMHKKYGNYFSAYFCPHCGGYHLGKNRNDRLRKYKVELMYNGIYLPVQTHHANNEQHVMAILGEGAIDFYNDIKITLI